MAVVNVDLSEYDMLRQMKDRAEAKVAELEKEIEGLKSQSRVILTSETRIANLDISEFSEVLANRLNNEAYDCFGYRASNFDIIRDTLRRMARTSKSTTVSRSTQFTGFDDVRDRVEENYRKQVQSELDDTLREAKAKRKEYEENLNTLNKTYFEAHAKEIKELKDQFDKKTEAYNKQLEDKDKELREANAKWADKLHAYSEQLYKNQDEIVTLKRELDRAKNKGFFSKLFG